MDELTRIPQVERFELWKAAIAARKRTGNPGHELNTELNAYCVLLALNPEEIVHIMRNAATVRESAVAAMAYRMATDGIQLVAE